MSQVYEVGIMGFSSRGGRHQGTLKPSWNYGKTKTMRVPIALENTIRKLARTIDHFQDDDIMLVPSGNLQEAIRLLEQSLNYKPNAGGKIKTEIKKAIKLLKDE